MRIVFLTCPQNQGIPLLRQLIQERLVAGGNIIPGVRSLYRWKGEVRDEPEEILLLETSDRRVEAMIARLQELHPYEVPKILAWEPQEGPLDYFQWVEMETQK